MDINLCSSLVLKVNVPLRFERLSKIRHRCLISFFFSSHVFNLTSSDDFFFLFFFCHIRAMYENLGAQPGVPRPPLNPQANPFGNAFYGAGSGLIRGGLGAYGERILGSSSEYVQSNVCSMQRLY